MDRTVGTNPAVFEGAAVKQLFERAMKRQSGTDLACYGEESVVGRLRAGVIRTGDIHTLESWQDPVTLVEIKGASLRGHCLQQLRSAGITISGDRTCSMATAGCVGDDQACETPGRIETRRTGVMLRDALIADLETQGFPGATARASADPARAVERDALTSFRTSPR